MSSELEICPFCGKDATSFSESQGWDSNGDNEYRAYAGCMNDKCGIGVELWHTGDDMCDERDDGEETASLLEDKAIAIWNTRAERMCHLKKEPGSRNMVSRRRCDVCGHPHFGNDVPNYCENCGAKVVNDE